MRRDLKLRCAVLVMLLVMMVRPAHAQDRLDQNPLDLTSDRSWRPSQLATLGFLEAGKPEVIGVWTLQPRTSITQRSVASGLSLSYRNNTAFSSLPFNVSFTERAVSSAVETRNRFQLFGGLDPDLKKLNPALSLSLTLSYARTVHVSSVTAGTAELSCKVPNANGLALGVIGHLDQVDPDSGPVQSGPTLGFTAGWQVKRGPLANKAEIQGEYDLESDFAGEDNFAIVGGYVLHAAPRVSLTAGVQKHKQFLVALKTSFTQYVR